MSNEFIFEKWLAKNSYWEDPDSVIMVGSTESGGVSICGYDGEDGVEGATLEEACIKYSELAIKYKDDDND